jgi:hypothetical protein
VSGSLVDTNIDRRTKGTNVNRYHCAIRGLAARCLIMAVGLTYILAIFVSPLLAQQASSDLASQVDTKPHGKAVPRSKFFSYDTFDEQTKQLSDELLQKALDSEAFYTLVGQLKPASEGFWGSYFTAETPDIAEIERVRSALRSWSVPDIFYADVLVYESIQQGQRYASAYVIHVPSLKKLITEEANFFGRWGITSETPPGEVMMAIERSRQPEDRWRGFGLVFGYPRYAIDFFVNAGLHQRNTGEFVERDFRHIATFGGRTGRFVYAVPKLSRPNAEDIELQRQAARPLSEFRRLRPQYLAHTKKPAELLRDWMDDGNGYCHPDHLIAKLASKTAAEIDAEIASWTTPEPKIPDVKFNHLYLVLNEKDFEALRKSDFMKAQWAASDQGFPKYLPVDDECQSIYLRGRDTYIEFLGPGNKFGEPVGKLGIGWSVENVGEIDTVQSLLAGEKPESFTRSLRQWDFDREGAVNWYHALFRNSAPAADVVWWFSETHVDFIPALFPEKSFDGHQIKRQDFLQARYDRKRILKNVTSLTINLSHSTAQILRNDLEQLGWRGEELDARAWVLTGPEFRLLLMLQAAETNPTLSSIGFETNQVPETPKSHTAGDNIEVLCNENQKGWIVFQR